MRLKMLGRTGLIAALLIYIAVTLGCMMFAPPESKNDFRQRASKPQHVGSRPTRVTGFRLRGVAMQLQRIVYMGTQSSQSIDDILYHYSWIAEKHGVDVFILGSELVSTESNVEEWRKTIDMVRGTFKGLVTYSANWDHYRDVGFWSELDFVSMNCYYKLGENHNVT